MSLKYALAIAILLLRVADVVAGQDERRWIVFGHDSASDLAAALTDFSVTRFDHPWEQDSVIASIEGTVIPNEIVLIGGHLDSINASDQSDAPGADDNASGIAVVSEVLRVVLASDFRPRRTLQFMAYAAEEVGLRGSRAIAREYDLAGKSVLGAMQLDMTGFRDRPATCISSPTT